MPYEHVTVTTFLDLFGLQDDRAKLTHSEAVTIDQQEGLLEGTDDIGAQIMGQSLTAIEQFIKANIAKFVAAYPTAPIAH